MQQDSNQRGESTRAIASQPKSYSEIPGLTDDQIERLFAQLSHRERLIGIALNRARSQRDLPSYEPTELLIKIRDCAPALQTVATWAIDYCFNEAVAFHVPAYPFQMSEVVSQWLGLSDQMKTQLFEKYRDRESLPPGPPCEKCGGRGMMPVDKAGQFIEMGSEAQAGVKRCECRAMK